MSNKTRFFTIALGVTALAGLTYGVTRRGLPRRAVQSLANQPSAGNVASSDLPLPRAAAASTPAAAASAPDWETLKVHSTTRGSTPDALDIAMNLDGLFDAESEERGITVRPSDRVPAPVGGDDEEAPGADDLGRTWLTQATQAEHSLRQADLIPEIDELAFSEETDAEAESDELDSDQLDSDEHESDEHEDFRTTRA